MPYKHTRYVSIRVQGPQWQLVHVSNVLSNLGICMWEGTRNANSIITLHPQLFLFHHSYSSVTTWFIWGYSLRQAVILGMPTIVFRSLNPLSRDLWAPSREYHFTVQWVWDRKEGSHTGAQIFPSPGPKFYTPHTLPHRNGQLGTVKRSRRGRGKGRETSAVRNWTENLSCSCPYSKSKMYWYLCKTPLQMFTYFYFISSYLNTTWLNVQAVLFLIHLQNSHRIPILIEQLAGPCNEAI